VLRIYWRWARLAQSDFLIWAITHLIFRTLLTQDGVSPEHYRQVEEDAAAMALLRATLQTYPARPRRAGLVNDLQQAEHYLPITGLEHLTVPTLIIHGTADNVAPYANAEFFARTIPGAVLQTVAGGGHLCIATHRQQTIPAMETFLHQHAPQYGIRNTQ
jgi:pimeloyl-ACP methyl ester carboxylesterase